MLPKPPTKLLPKTSTPAADENWSDRFGIQFNGNLCTITTTVDIKLSRNYQSAGIQGGLTFTTRADRADQSIAAAFDKLREALKPQVDAN